MVELMQIIRVVVEGILYNTVLQLGKSSSQSDAFPWKKYHYSSRKHPEKYKVEHLLKVNATVLRATWPIAAELHTLHVENKRAIIGFSVRGKCHGWVWFQNFSNFFCKFLVLF